MTISIDIDKSQIIDTLARTTGYIGSKSPDAEAGAYTRISLNEGDAKLLDRFFQECRDHLCLTLRHQLEEETLLGKAYKVVLRLSSSFDESLVATIRTGIANYFVQSMASKWLSITDKSQADEYASSAADTLDQLIRKIYCKRKPQRPTYK